MKRLVLALAAPALILVATWYGTPQLYQEPLTRLNRSLAGLSEHTLTLGPHRIHYLEGGQGETVVLLHGIFAEKDHWVDFARALTGRYRVIIPDLPGYGASSRLEHEAYDYAAQTRRLGELLDALGVQQVHLAGNSMGGTLAALLALAQPQRVASVAFIGAPHGIRTPRPSVMDLRIAAGAAPLVARNDAEFAETMALLFARPPFLPYPILHAAQATAVQRAPSNQRLWREQLQDRYLLHARVGALQAPVLALWGSEDRVFDASGAQALGALLPRAQVEVLPGIGHLPMMEAPAETAARHLKFLQRPALR